MSRNIDPDRIASLDLTEEEIRYLQDRNQLTPKQLKRLAKRQLVEEEPEEEPEEQEVPTIATNGGIQDEVEEDYDDGWNNDQRRAELARRKLSVDGKKDDLIGRLRRSDMDDLQDDDHSTLND